MKFDIVVNDILKENKEDEVTNSVEYVMKEYGLDLDEVYNMIEEFESDPNFWDYFRSFQDEKQVNSLMKEMAPDLYQKRLKRIQDMINRDAMKGHELEDLYNL
jgi:hypothetical protein